MSYKDKILNLQPKHYFPLDPNNSFFDYNGRDFNGAILDTVNNVVLDSVFKGVILKPTTIEMFTGSITSNQILNNSLVVGTEGNIPYTITHSNFNQAVNSMPDSQDTSVSFNLRINKDDVSIFELVNTRTVMVYINDVYQSDAEYRGNSLTFTSILIDVGDVYNYTFVDSFSGDILYSYRLEAQMLDNPTLTQKVDFDIGNTNLNGINNTIVLKNVYYDEGGQGRRYLTKPSAIVNNTATVTFVFESFIDVITPTTQAVLKDAIYAQSEFMKIGGISFLIVRRKNGSGNKTYNIVVTNTFLGASGNSVENVVVPIQIDRNYNVVVTFDATNGGIEHATVARFYLNGLLVNTKHIELSFISHDLLTSFFSVGDSYNILQTGLTVSSGFIRLQNVAVFDRVLGADDVLFLHQATFNFLDYIRNELKPSHMFEFGVVSNSQVSSVSSGILSSTSHKISGRKTRFGFDITGVSYNGTGALLTSGNNLATVNIQNDFSIIMLLNTKNSAGVLFSQQNRGLAMNGLTVSYSDSLLIVQNGINIQQEPFIMPINQDIVLFIRKQQLTLTITIHDSDTNILSNIVFTLQKQVVNYQSDCYYMSAFNSDIQSLQFDLYGIYVYSYDVGVNFINIFRNNTFFTNNGVILLRNLPTNATLRVYDINTGEHLDTLQTNLGGQFEFINLYQRKVHIMVYDIDSRIVDVIAPVVTGE